MADADRRRRAGLRRRAGGIRTISADYEGRLHAFRKEEADLVATRRPAAERTALRKRRAALLSGMEQSLRDRLAELEELRLNSTKVAAAAEHRFRFEVERRHDAATAVAALPFPRVGGLSLWRAADGHDSGKTR